MASVVNYCEGAGFVYLFASTMAQVSSHLPVLAGRIALRHWACNEVGKAVRAPPLLPWIWLFHVTAIWFRRYIGFSEGYPPFLAIVTKVGLRQTEVDPKKGCVLKSRAP